MAMAPLSGELQNDIDSILNMASVTSLLHVVSRSTGMRFVAIARVTDKKWITCVSRDENNFGLASGDELELETTLCNEIGQHTDPIVIENVSGDPRYRSHHTPAQYGFQSYISFPIHRRDGRFFGTLCAMDPSPAKLEDRQVRELFELCTELISHHLDSMEQLREVSASLREEKRLGELRETFIAVLGHDLRNPVGTTRMCADILLGLDIPENALRQARTIKSTSYRMQGLIDNLLDFAKGHLGEGIQLEPSDDISVLKNTLEQVAGEIETIDSGHQLMSDINIDTKFSCDANRLGQLYSNLLGNAMKHGAPKMPIVTRAYTADQKFVLSVSNSGERIAEGKIGDLFKPFFTTNSSSNRSGLGLGLYICSEIARAHGGKMSVSSTDARTSFTFTMPLNTGIKNGPEPKAKGGKGTRK